MKIILYIIFVGISPILLLPLFLNPITAYLSIALCLLGVAIVQRRNHNHSVEYDSKISQERMIQAIDRYVEEVKKKNVEN